MMLIYKPDMKPYHVYDILIYRNGQWVYRSAKHFVPDDQT